MNGIFVVSLTETWSYSSRLRNLFTW